MVAADPPASRRISARFHSLHIRQLTSFRFMRFVMLRPTIFLRPLAPLALLLPFLAAACGDDVELVGIDNGNAGSSGANGSGTSGSGGRGSGGSSFGASGSSGNGSGTSGSGGAAVVADTTSPT